MKNLLLTLIITLPLTLLGQGWEKTYGGVDYDWGTSGQQTTDGGYIITGSTRSFGNGQSDVYLIKTDNNGDTLWTKTFGGLEEDEGRSVQQTNDGGYIITGIKGSDLFVGEDVWLIKTDSQGDSLWTKTFGDGEGRSVQQTSDGGYIITGRIYSLGNSLDLSLIKTNNYGDSIWTKTFGGLDQDVGCSIQQTTDGGYIVTGRTQSLGNGDDDVWLIKTDGNGQEQWSQTFGGLYDDRGTSVQQTTDGGYIVTGITHSFGNGESDVWLIKTDVNGTEQWNQTFGDVDYDVGESVQQTSDGGYIITGWTNSFGNGQQDVWLIKTDENGTEQWNQTFGGINDDWGFSVQQTSDGGYIITGGGDSFTNGYDNVYMIKTDDQGNITSTFEIPLPNPDRKLEKTVNLKGQEINPKTNQPYIEIFDDGSVEKKIVVE